jgi:hypothetical protein
MLKVVSPSTVPDPAYPAETRAKGWKFTLDYERMEQSDTWALTPPEVRPWLLMLWLTAWKQMPCGTLPNDDTLVAARIGMPAREFAAWRDVLMRGWVLHSDGRLYHATITEQVLSMIEKRQTEAERKKAWRDRKHVGEVDVPRDSSGSPPSLTTPEPEPVDKEIPTPNGVGGIDDADAASNPVPAADTESLPDCPAQKLVDLYHAALPTLPVCLVLTTTRRGYLRARWREYAALHRWRTVDEGLAFFADYFAHVARSKFLTGRTAGREGRPPFAADLEWLFRPTNFAKVIEGKYHA